MKINNLVQLGLERLNLSSQSLHLLRLCGNDLGLLGNQVFDLLDFLGDSSGGHTCLASRRRGNRGLNLQILASEACNLTG